MSQVHLIVGLPAGTRILEEISVNDLHGIECTMSERIYALGKVTSIT